MLNRCPACSTDSMPESTDSKQTFDHVVAFIDILGSSQILKSDDEKAISDYLEGIEGMYLHSRDVTEEVKMFSDNILIFFTGIDRRGRSICDILCCTDSVGGYEGFQSLHPWGCSHRQIR